MYGYVTRCKHITPITLAVLVGEKEDGVPAPSQELVGWGPDKGVTVKSCNDGPQQERQKMILGEGKDAEKYKSR
jgi:hypothetical protein